MITLMLTGGEALKDLVARRASCEFDQLLNRDPLNGYFCSFLHSFFFALETRKTS